jgi:hypothetical protein
VFSTLLGPLPPDPDHPGDADDHADDHADGADGRVAGDAGSARARLEAVAALEAVGLELVTDGRAAEPSEPGPDVVARWQAAAAASQVPVKQVLVGPWSAARRTGADPAAVAEALRPTILALAEAGCPLVEIAEADAVAIATDPAAANAFADAHRRLVDGDEGVHCSLALTGGNVDAAGPATFFDLAYASFAFDLIAGPDNWRLIVDAPADRGIVCGAIGLAPDADTTREVLVWAAHYAASTRNRGLARVGLANAPSAPDAPQPGRAEVLRRLAIVAEASRIASVESGEEMASLLDPRAIDPRSAALGRFAPHRRRRAGRTEP